MTETKFDWFCSSIAYFLLLLAHHWERGSENNVFLCTKKSPITIVSPDLENIPLSSEIIKLCDVALKLLKKIIKTNLVVVPLGLNPFFSSRFTFCVYITPFFLETSFKPDKVVLSVLCRKLYDCLAHLQGQGQLY